MVSIFLIFSASLLLLVGTSLVFYKWDWKAVVVFIPGIVIFNVLSEKSGGLYFYEFLNFFIEPSLVGAVAGLSFKRKKSLQFFLIVSSLLLTGIFSGNYYYLKNVEKIDLLSKSKNEFIKVLSSADISAEEKESIKKKIEKSVEIARDAVPFVYFINSMFYIFLAFFILKYIVKRYLPGEDISFY